MTSYVALLRAVNLGAASTMPMADLRRIADELGFARARTFIASGNLLFDANADELTVKLALEAKLAAYAGRPIGVMIRTGTEMAGVVAANPLSDRPGDRTVAIFLDTMPPPDTLTRVTGRVGEEIRLGAREIYVAYDQGMGRSKLRIAAAAGQGGT